MPHTTKRPRIHYRVELGTSALPPVVFVQGLGLSSRFWFDIPSTVHAETGRTTVIIDNRGTGQSDRVRRPFRIGDMADDVALILDEAGLPPSVIVGISLGGMIAQEVALRHPDKVAGLVLMATTPGLPLGRLPSPSALATLLSLPFASDTDHSRTAALLLSKRDLPQAEALFSRWPAAMAADPLRPTTFFTQLLAGALHSTGRRLGRIGCPTVVVAGAEDRLIPPVNGERIAAKIPHSVFQLIADASHAIPTSDPGVVGRALATLATLGAAQK